jgi:hypothetical protein
VGYAESWRRADGEGAVAPRLRGTGRQKYPRRIGKIFFVSARNCPVQLLRVRVRTAGLRGGLERWRKNLAACRSHVTPPRDERQPPMLPQRLHMLDHRFLIAIPVPVRRGNQFKTCDSPHHPSSHTANSVANFPFFPSHTYRIRHHGVSNGVGYDAAAIGPRVRCEIEPSTTAKISLCLIWAIWAISLGLSTSSASGYGRIRRK